MNKKLPKLIINFFIFFFIFFIFSSLHSPAYGYLTSIGGNTVAYSFYHCSDNPVTCISLACSNPGYPDWDFYCADYCECPPAQACYTVHRCYNECTIDLPPLPSQGGNWNGCLGPTPTPTPIPCSVNAPTNLTASRINGSTVDLSFTDNATNENRFRIRRRTGSSSLNLGGWSLMATRGPYTAANPAQTGMVGDPDDTNAPDTQCYQWEVRSETDSAGGCNSSYTLSNIICVQPTPTPTSSPAGKTLRVYICSPTPTPTPTQGAWFQAKGSDVRTEGNISSALPASNYFCLDGEGGYPGVVIYNGGAASFALGDISTKKWLAKTGYTTKGYDYFYTLLGWPTMVTPPAALSDDDLPTGDGVVAFDGNIQTDSANILNVGTKKIVILVNGKLLLRHKITIDSGGSLIFIVKGDIGLSKNVSAPGDSPSNRLQGIFLTDGTFYTSVDPDFSLTPADSNKKLVVDGGVMAKRIDFRRDCEALGGGDCDNKIEPVETFRYDPSLVINSYNGIWETASTWEEVAP